MLQQQRPSPSPEECIEHASDARYPAAAGVAVDVLETARCERAEAEPTRTRPGYGVKVARRSERKAGRPIAVAVTALVLAASASAAAAHELARTELLVSAPVGNAFYAHLWREATPTGGECSFVSSDHKRDPAPPTRFNGGGDCSAASPGRRLPHPLVIGLNMRRKLKGDPQRWVPPIVYGRVSRALRAASVSIQWRGGTHRLALKNDSFLGGTRKLYMPPFKAFPFYVVATDASGRTVAQRKLESPALRLLGSWREYARKYNEWKRSAKKR